MIPFGTGSDWSFQDEPYYFILPSTAEFGITLMNASAMSGSAKNAPVCANFLSRLLARSFSEDQWVLPIHNHTLAHRWFRWYEKHRMKITLDGIAIDRPVFIISLPRSGSSMLQDLLCAHPSVAYITNMMYTFPDCFCAAEHFRKRLHLDVRGERFLQDSVEVGIGSPADPVGMWGAWLKQDLFELACRPYRIIEFTPGEIAAIHDAIRRVLWCFGGVNRRYLCKTPALLPHILFLRDLFPDARFIHLVRDARPNANSMLKLHRLCHEQWQRIRTRRPGVSDQSTFVPYPRLPGLPELVERFGVDDLRTTAHLWNEAMAFIQAARPQIPTNQFHEVRYEDIVARPQEELAHIFRFLDLPEPGAAATTYHMRLAGVGKVRHQNQYNGFEIVEGICGPTMRRYGYM